MKNITKAIMLLISTTAIAGCIEDNTYYSDYRDSGYYSSNANDATVGYNRDYHHRKQGNRNYNPNKSSGGSGYSSSQTSVSSGYYSGNNSYSSSGSPANGGYSSTGSSGNYQRFAKEQDPNARHHKGMFGKALGEFQGKMKAPVSPSASVNKSGWSISTPAPANSSAEDPSADSYSSSDNSKEESTQMSSSADNGYSSGYSSSH